MPNAGFNSTIVRLKVIITQRNCGILAPFQFYDSAIKRDEKRN